METKNHIEYNENTKSDIMIEYNIFNNNKYAGTLQLFRCTVSNYVNSYGINSFVWLYKKENEDSWRNVNNTFAKNFLKLMIVEMKKVEKWKNRTRHNRSLGKSFTEIENNQTEISEKRKQQLSYIK